MHETDRTGGSLRHGGAQAGFTLLETMVVVVILGILLAVAMPDMGRRSEWSRLQGAAGDLSTHLQTARATAVARRVPYRVVLNPTARSYVVERQEADLSWVRDPDEVYVAEGVEEMQVEVGGDAGAATVVMEPRGTVLAEDAPARFRFLGSRGDSAEVSLVRTGRVTVRMARAHS